MVLSETLSSVTERGNLHTYMENLLCPLSDSVGFVLINRELLFCLSGSARIGREQGGGRGGEEVRLTLRVYVCVCVRACVCVCVCGERVQLVL